MNHNQIPGKASLSTTSFGISKREVVLLGATIFIGLILLAIPYAPVFIRVAVSFIFMGGLALYTFWRVEKQWPIEVYVINKIRYMTRNRAYVKGGESIVIPKQSNEPSRSNKQGKSAIPDTYAPEGGYLFEVASFTNAQLLATITGMVFLAILLACAGTGGIEDAQNQLRYLLRS
ncbi:hypothetical protein KQH40_00960 [bacterium]|nr:hypothetical protein [bacterium]